MNGSRGGVSDIERFLERTAFERQGMRGLSMPTRIFCSSDSFSSVESEPQGKQSMMRNTRFCFALNLVLSLPFWMNGPTTNAQDVMASGLDWSAGVAAVVVEIPAQSGKTLHFAAGQLVRYLKKNDPGSARYLCLSGQGAGEFSASGFRLVRSG